MAADLPTLLHDALQLPADERADLVTRLLASLDPLATNDLDDAEWIAEIEARARRAIAGETGTAWPEALERVRHELHRK